MSNNFPCDLVYVFGQFPLLFADFMHPLSLSRSLSLSDSKNNTNSANECFYFIFELFECPHSGSNELLTFYACLSSGFPALFIYIRSERAAIGDPKIWTP